MAIVKGTKENFEAEVLKANGVVVVDFGANWCGPCKSLVPILDEVVEEDPNKKIVKVDIDKNKELSKALKISTIPTIIIFNKQSLIWRGEGFQDTEVLMKELNKFLQ